jgi:hypothetical protein
VLLLSSSPDPTASGVHSPVGGGGGGGGGGGAGTVTVRIGYLDTAGLASVVATGATEGAESAGSQRAGIGAALAAFEAAGFDVVVVGDGGLGPAVGLVREVAIGQAAAAELTGLAPRTAAAARKASETEIAEKAEAARLQEAYHLSVY